jgi:subtilisin family serine protease
VPRRGEVWDIKGQEERSVAGDRYSRGIRAVVALTAAVMTVAVLPAVARAEPDAASGPTFRIVSFDRPISDSMRAAVVGAKARVVDYEAENSYIVWADDSAAGRIRKLDFVKDVAGLTRERQGLRTLSNFSEAPFVQATVYGRRLTATVADLAVLGDVVDAYPARSDGLLYTVSISVAVTNLDELVDHPAVMHVSPSPLRGFTEDELSDQVLAGNLPMSTSGGDAPPKPGYPNWLKKIGLTGKGINVSIVDTGITQLHPDISDRVVATYDYSPIAEPVDSGGHGSHVTGIVGGVPSGPVPLRDPDGFLYGQGVAPGVRFVNQNAISTIASNEHVGSFPPQGGWQTLTQDAWKAGARMWNASWHTGEGNRAGYLESVRAMDELARDALPKKDGGEEFLFVFSAGNSGSGGPTVPKEAKNIIAVGSTGSGRGIHYPLKSDINSVSSYSSKGPTKDGRIFPTVSAPGENVVSARAPDGALPCQGPIDAAALYCTISGTSMAAPHVTGASALIHQWWKEKKGGPPSPAMVKALLVNSATDIGPADIPNMNEGWGRVNLGDLFRKVPSRYVDQSQTFARRGQTKSYTVKVKNSRDDLKVTLAWADAPAAVGAKKVLVNDLDLSVQRVRGKGGRDHWLGNFFKKGRSATGGKVDHLNNLENVFLKKPGPGIYKITVRASNLPGDGVPKNKDKTDQDFALVTRTPAPLIEGTRGGPGDDG